MSFKGNALIQGYNKCKFKAKVRIDQHTSTSDEFTSPNQECFHDYKVDYLWVFNFVCFPIRGMKKTSF
ncbi:hypothetical protein LXL04_012345 [Taraxacum kok-saghyz]